MHRLFGRKKDAQPKESLGDAVRRLDTKATEHDKKIEAADKELSEIKAKLSKLPEGPSKSALKQKAITILRRKTMYEGQREAILNQSLALEQADMSMDTMKNTANALEALSLAQRDMRKLSKTIQSPEHVQDLMFEMREFSEELNSLMQGYSATDVDESALDAELAGLCEEQVFETDTSYATSLEEKPVQQKLATPT